MNQVDNLLAKPSIYKTEQRNKPAQKQVGITGLNSPKPNPKRETGETNKTQPTEKEKGIGGSQQTGDNAHRAPPEQEGSHLWWKS